MSFEWGILITLISSFLGLAILVFRKIPLLVKMPAVARESKDEDSFLKLREKIKSVPGLKSFSFEIFLQKIISKIRVLSLRTERKTFHWLERLRAKNKRKKLEDNNYWEELKNSTDSNNKNHQ